MTNIEDFIKAIKKSPQDDAHRLIYADYLEEQGNIDYADLIRYSIDLYNIEDGSDRRSELIGTIASIIDSGKDWIYQPFECKGDYSWNGLYSEDFQITLNLYRPNQIIFTYVRGLVEQINCSMETWLEYGKRITKIHPIKQVLITDKSPILDYPFYKFYNLNNQKNNDKLMASFIPGEIFEEMQKIKSHPRIGNGNLNTLTSICKDDLTNLLCEASLNWGDL